MHWKNNKSWKRNPVFLSCGLAQCDSKYYLVEGRTRVALLNGLVAKGICSTESKHKIWLGRELK